MTYVEIPQDSTYKSWIKLEEDAKRTIMKLEQHNRILTITDIEEAYANSALFLDTTGFKNS